MKRVINAGFDPGTNPTDAARACVAMLNSDITKLHNLVKRWANVVQEHPDDDAAMSQIVDKSSYLQKRIDEILDYYSKPDRR